MGGSRRFRARLVPLLVVALAVPCTAAANARRDAAAPLRARTQARADLFADWLRRGDARGLIGEVGWPADDRRWQTVARAFYARASRRGLWVAAWTTGELWARSYKLLVYRPRKQGQPVSVVNPQAAVVEVQPRPSLRGINVEQGAFGEFGAGYNPVARKSPLHNRNVGEYGRIYSYPQLRTYEFLAARGIRFVRLPFRWERIQRRLGAPLDEKEARRLVASVRAAGKAGLEVVLDCHNYGAYYLGNGSVGRRVPLGSAALTSRHFGDLWARLARRFAREPAVLGYALMNEPVALPAGARTWEAASRTAVRAIRDTGDRRRVFVASYHWGGTWQFQHYHRRGPWIDDAARNTWYEAHLYFDSDQTARYRLSFDAEVARARAEGY